MRRFAQFWYELVKMERFVKVHHNYRFDVLFCCPDLRLHLQFFLCFQLFPVFKFLHNFFLRSLCPLHPGVSQRIAQRETLTRTRLEHTAKQVPQLRREVQSLPEFILV